MRLSPLTCYLVPFRPKYSLQHPILKHPQPTFFPKRQRPSFTPAQNNRQNYSSLDSKNKLKLIGMGFPWFNLQYCFNFWPKCLKKWENK
jgi:hypothetical protein